MSNQLKIFIVITLWAFASATHHKLPPFQEKRPDIVMIDTGTTKSYSGFIRMEKSCKKECWHNHGEKMARALEDEVNMMGFDREITVKHLIWKGAESIPGLVDQAAQLRPKIIVMAIAGEGVIMEEYYAVKRATEKGILILAAAGNKGGNAQPEFPAGYDLPCLVAVSTKEYGVKVDSANLGEIYIERMSGERGTSFSTARSAAYALKLYERYGNLSCQMIKSLLVRELGSAQ